MTKKGQNLSFSTLIIAVLGLVVLIVSIVVFTGRVGIFSKNVGGSCIDQGGKCSSAGKCDDEFPIKIIASGCTFYNAEGGSDSTKNGGQCCLPFS